MFKNNLEAIVNHAFVSPKPSPAPTHLSELETALVLHTNFSLNSTFLDLHFNIAKDWKSLNCGPISTVSMISPEEYVLHAQGTFTHRLLL